MKQRRAVWNHDVYEFFAEQPTPSEPQDDADWDAIDSEEENGDREDEEDW
jgi:hypothetical protein